jgi:tetratricopeptide (TPR) repeat protein
MIRKVVYAVSLVLGSMVLTDPVSAADRQWMEVKSPHFTVATDDSEKTARNLAWQFEQVREVIRQTCPWAPSDIPKPFLVLAVRDENGIKALLPQFWDRFDGPRYSSYSMSAPDRQYVAMRADVLGENTQITNPYQPAFWAYAFVAINSGLSRDLPLWFSRGLADVLSNAIVSNSAVDIGLPYPSKLQLLNGSQRLRLKDLLAADRTSPWMTDPARLPVFDAEAWAFMHFLTYAEDGAHRKRIDQFIAALKRGTAVPAAIDLAFKDIDTLEDAFTAYIKRPVFSYEKLKVEASVKRETFPSRRWSPAESSATRALFHAAMKRPVEARALLEEARKTEPNLPLVFETEARLMENDNRTAEARALFGKAVDAGSDSFYAHYRFATLTYAPGASADDLEKAERSLDTATRLNPISASSYLMLGELRMQRGRAAEGVAPLERAVALEPDRVRNRVSLARALSAARRPEEAQRVLQEAMAMASDDMERRSVQQALGMVQRPSGPPPR